MCGRTHWHVASLRQNSKILIISIHQNHVKTFCFTVVVDSFVSEASEPAAVEKPKEQAPKPSSQTPVSAPTTNGTDLPDLDLATLKERSKASSRKKGAPQSNWNNRQAIFNNL